MKLIVGYGNTLRQDDGIGPVIADRLEPQFANTDVQIITAHQLMPEIAATVAEAERVIFVDAAIHGKPGEVRVAELAPAGTMTDAHTLGPAEILRLADHLYGRVPPTFLVTITGADFDLGESLSDAVHAAIPDAIQRITALIEKLDSSA